MRGSVLKIAGMARPPSHKFDTLYIGPWLTRLGRKAGEVAKASGVDEGYMSQLISGEKRNPSGATLMKISTELGIPVNALYEKPPEMDVTGPARLLTTDQLNALRSLLGPVKPSKDN